MRAPAPEERDDRILALWERAAGLSRSLREDVLLASTGSVPAALGARNERLLLLRGALFQRAWRLKSRCPACQADSEFELNSTALAEEVKALGAAAQRAAVDVAGRALELRAPTVDDLRAVSGSPDTASAVRALLARCAAGAPGLDDLDESALAELGSHLERLDPGAVVSFSLRCPGCRHEWLATVDVGEALWAELQHAAEDVLMEVDALARAYGWTEPEVLRLSPARRAAYLQLVAAS